MEAEATKLPKTIPASQKAASAPQFSFIKKRASSWFLQGSTPPDQLPARGSRRYGMGVGGHLLLREKGAVINHLNNLLN
jgi:hypothetical protein